MSKLTRSVIYLNESDRPKKVEPLKFKAWFEANYYLKTKDFELEDIDNHVERYATYLQEFIAEEVPVEWTGYLDKDKMVWNTGKMRQPTDLNDNSKLFYMGKDRNHGDMFYDIDSVGQICIFRGKLNSGKY